MNYEEVFSEVEEAQSRNFHIVRGTQLDLNLEFVKDFGNNRTLSINPSTEFINVADELDDPDEPRFFFFDEAGRSANDFRRKLYAGLGLHYTSDRANSPTNPTRGYVFKIGADYKQNLSESDFSNLTLSSNVAAYIPFTLSLIHI